MDFGHLFRSLFGLRSHHDHFPIIDSDPFNEEESDENESQTEFPFFFGLGGSSSLDDMFHHLHSDMHEQMESLHAQMEGIFREFETVTSDHLPSADRQGFFDKPEPDSGGDKRVMWFFDQPGFKKKEKDPRGSMLKEDEGRQIKALPSPPAAPPSQEQNKNLNTPYTVLPWNRSDQDSRKDTDLDGKVSSSDVMDLIKKSDGPLWQEKKPAQRHGGFFSSQSVSMSTIRGPDGKVEEKRVVRDSSGREESFVSRSIDGQTHTVRTIKQKDGQEERHEDLKNMDEKDVPKFEEKWTSQPPAQAPCGSPVDPYSRLHPRDWDLFSRFSKFP